MLKTTSEVAKIYGFSATYIRKMINDGRIEAIKIGKIYLIESDKMVKIDRIRSPRKKKRKKKRG